MDFGLKGKRALVGGASKGLGLACARALAEEGCAVALVSRSRENLDAALKTLTADTALLPIVADLSTEDGVNTCLRAAQAWGPIDILVNNTGGPPPGTSMEHDEKAWLKACESLLFYVKRMCEALVPPMRERRWGRVITITSKTVKEPAGNLVLSNVFRSAVTAYLKGLSTEVAGDGVTVNTVLPGAFRTERYEQLLDAAVARSGREKEEIAAEIVAELPIHRFQRTEELGALVAFLASEPASGINGTAIPVDGGAIKGLFG